MELIRPGRHLSPQAHRAISEAAHRRAEKPANASQAEAKTRLGDRSPAGKATNVEFKSQRLQEGQWRRSLHRPANQKRSRKAQRGRGLDSSSPTVPAPWSPVASFFTGSSFFPVAGEETLAVPARDAWFLAEKWQCAWDSDPFSHPQDRRQVQAGS